LDSVKSQNVSDDVSYASATSDTVSEDRKDANAVDDVVEYADVDADVSVVTVALDVVDVVFVDYAAVIVYHAVDSDDTLDVSVDVVLSVVRQYVTTSVLLCITVLYIISTSRGFPVVERSSSRSKEAS